MKWIKMVSPVDGTVSSVDEYAFEKIWEPKGWTRVDALEPVVEEDFNDDDEDDADDDEFGIEITD